LATVTDPDATGVGLARGHFQHRVGGQRLAEKQVVDLRRLQPGELGLAGDLEFAAAGRDRHVVLAEQRLDLAVEVDRDGVQGTEQARRCAGHVGAFADERAAAEGVLGHWEVLLREELNGKSELRMANSE
jgi:hypothetical protein